MLIGAASVQEEFVRGIPVKTRIRGGRAAQTTAAKCIAGKSGLAYCDDDDVCVAKNLMVIINNLVLMMFSNIFK